MRTLCVGLGARGYPIHIGAGLLRDAGRLLAPILPAPRAVIVSNAVVAASWLPPLRESLAATGIASDAVLVPDGESHKTLHTLDAVITQLIELRAERTTTVIALGGGVVGDIAGFAAATYLRGVPLVQVPTTLLAQVDSSVGGKTGVNHPLGKNLIGAFYQPGAVLIDPDCLRTLPERELNAGLAEVVKYGAIRDRSFFEWLEQNIDRLLRARPAGAGARDREELRDQGGRRRRGRARIGRAGAAQLRPHASVTRSRPARDTVVGCMAKRSRPGW